MEPTAVLDELEGSLKDAVQHCLAYRQYRPSSDSRFCKYGPKTSLFRILNLPCDYPLPARRPYGGGSASYSLGLTDYTGMNDPTEGRLLLQKLDAPEDPEIVGERAELRLVVQAARRFQLGDLALRTNLKAAREEMMFISCFSEARNSLDLWRLYGDNGKGICLVVNPTNLLDAHKNCLYTVGYRPRDVCNALDNILQPALLLKQLFDHEPASAAVRERAIRAIVEAHDRIRYLFKFDSYSIEQEVRYLRPGSAVGGEVNAFSPEAGVMRLFTEVTDFFTRESLVEVIVGPACDLRVEAVQIALCDSGLPNVKVWKSTHPYR